MRLGGAGVNATGGDSAWWSPRSEGRDQRLSPFAAATTPTCTGLAIEQPLTDWRTRMFRSTAAEPATVTEPTHDVANPSNLIPLSYLELDLAAPAAGWAVYLADRGMSIVLDDVGRASITRDAVRDLLTEQRDGEARRARLQAETERQAIEADKQWRARLPRGTPWYEIPDGVLPVLAMTQADR